MFHAELFIDQTTMLLQASPKISLDSSLKGISHIDQNADSH